MVEKVSQSSWLTGRRKMCTFEEERKEGDISIRNIWGEIISLSLFSSVLQLLVLQPGIVRWVQSWSCYSHSTWRVWGGVHVGCGWPDGMGGRGRRDASLLHGAFGEGTTMVDWLSLFLCWFCSQEAEAPSLKALLMDPYIIVAAGRVCFSTRGETFHFDFK